MIVATTAVGCWWPRVFLFKIVGFDFLPRDDQSEFEVAITLPEGYSLEQARQALRRNRRPAGQAPRGDHVFSTIGDTTGRISRGQGDVTTGTIYARLVDLEERQRASGTTRGSGSTAIFNRTGGRSAVLPPVRRATRQPARS